MSIIMMSSPPFRLLTSLHKLVSNGTLARNFSLNPILFTTNHSREARFMNKLMGRNKTRAKFYNFDGSDRPTPGGITVSRPVNQRRISVLNKLFMKNITEVLATGSMAHSIEGLGIEINKVAITSDFQHVNVLFVCKASPRPAGLEELLADAGFSLRHELSKLKLMGEVPRINFVEDKTMKRLAEVQELLAKADKGPEDECVSDLEQPQEEAVDNFPQRVYGLNHTKIYDKITAAKRASSVHKEKSDVPKVQEGVQYTTAKAHTAFQTEHPKHMINQYLKESRAESKQ